MTFKALEPHEANILDRVKKNTQRKRPPHAADDSRWLILDTTAEVYRVDYQRQGNFTVCILERKLSSRSRGYFIGVSKRNPIDCLAKTNGGRLALRRAFEKVGYVPPLRCKP